MKLNIFDDRMPQAYGGDNSRSILVGVKMDRIQNLYNQLLQITIFNYASQILEREPLMQLHPTAPHNSRSEDTASPCWVSQSSCMDGLLLQRI